eukprot:scaffold7039_cov153-Skeletonema_dohrnii-CCMP3373.AAC.1
MLLCRWRFRYFCTNGHKMCDGTEYKGRCTTQFTLRSSSVDIDPPRLEEAVWGGKSIGGAWA